MCISQQDSFLWQDISVATSVCFGATTVMDGDTVFTNHVNFIQQGTLDLCASIRRSYSTLSPSISRLSSESTGLDSLESGLSPSFIRGEQPYDLHEEDIAKRDGRQTDMMKNTDREKPRRCALIWPKQHDVSSQWFEFFYWLILKSKLTYSTLIA